MGSKSAIGIGNGICFKQVRDKGGGSYIDPLVRDSLVGVWIADQNTNESPTRNIIKNKIKDKGGDLELLNFAYKANSGYNGYPEDFTSWRNSVHLQVEYSTDGSKFKITSENIKDWWIIVPNSGISNSFKVKITNCHFPIVWRYTDDGNTYKDITISEDGIYNLPQSIINKEGVANRCCFGNGTQRNDYTGLTIEQLPLHEGALVTDGKDDMIVSQKTVQEMGVTNEITVVSMIHQIGILSEYNKAFNNYIRNQNVGSIRNNIAGVGIDKTGIYGYTWNNSTKSVINNILGDKNDYDIEFGVSVSIEAKFTVEGYINNGSPNEISKVAVYWTFIANKVLTTDEINQIIAYFNLDKYVTPQVIYDVKRQGLTNDTPAADWYLKDFSGNGHDMQLYNYAKTPESGINEDGGLQSDGIDDYGKAEGLPIFKDYTVAADYARLSYGNIDSAIISKSYATGNGAFGFNLASGQSPNNVSAISFGTGSAKIQTDDNYRKIRYQSKYVNDGVDINAGNGIDGNEMWLSCLRENYNFSESALYSMLLFPYSLSEFLLERQLKKYELGTLYPDMVEFRPVVKSSSEYQVVDFYINNLPAVVGKYYPINFILRIVITTQGQADEVSSIKVNGVDFGVPSVNGNKFTFNGILSDKSPQKIYITIDEYIRFEDIVHPYPAIVNLSQDGKSIT